jgi:hypothetical protein
MKPEEGQGRTIVKEQMKQMLAGTAIAVVSATAAAIVVGYVVRSSPGAVAPRETLPLPPVTSNPIQRSLPPWLQSGGTNAPGSPVSPPQALLSAQSFPAVQKAREAYLEAQKKYMAALQSAMGKQPGPVVPPMMTKPPVLPGSTTTNPSVRVLPSPPSER